MLSRSQYQNNTNHIEFQGWLYREVARPWRRRCKRFRGHFAYKPADIVDGEFARSNVSPGLIAANVDTIDIAV
jgi:hypothetical protein